MPDANREAGPVSASASAGVFATTHWSVVLAAGQKDSPHTAAALEKLCRTYWYPLYAYVRRRGSSPEDAQDLTQSFFARLLERGLDADADLPTFLRFVGRLDSDRLRSVREVMSRISATSCTRAFTSGAAILRLRSGNARLSKTLMVS